MLSYDGFGRLKTSTSLAGVSGKEMTTTRNYDQLDRVTRVTDALGGEQDTVYDTRGFLQRFDNERDHSTYFRYDDIGRLEARWQEGFSQTTGSTRYTYDAMDRVNTITDPLNNVTDYDYDFVGRVTKRTDPVQSAGTPVTAYAYDVDGNLASVTDPANNVTSYKYDHRNRLRQDTITTSGAAATRDYWYDDADNLAWVKDRENRWTKYTFDFAFGASGNYRLKEEAWWVSGSTYSNKITTSYDQAQGNGLLVTEVRDQRNLTTNSDVTSRVGFGYDALARVTLTRDWLQPNTQTEAFELKYFYLDAVDRRTSTEARFVQYASGGVSETGDQLDFHNTYLWDKLNRVDVVTQQSANDPLAVTWTAKAVTTRTVDLNYFADSSLQTISRTQGAVGSATAALVTTFVTVLDGAKNEGRIQSITQSGLTAGNVAYTYGYDDHGRIASFTSPAGTRIYAYDTFDQVIGATGGTQSAELYEYDKNGNRTNVPPSSGGGSVVTGAYNRVTNDGTYTYLYDKEGNRTRRTLTSTGEYETYVWDYRQRLVSVTKKTVANVTQQTVTYEYDGLDRRIRRTVANGAGTVTDKQRFLYDTNAIDPSFDEVVIVLDELVSGESYQKVDHRYMNGPDIDQVFADEAPGNSVLWYLSDHQNTVRDVAKYASTAAGSQATVRNHLEYDSFGNVTSVDDPTTGTVNDGDQPGLEGTGNEYSPQGSYTGREPDSATGLIYYRARWYDAKLGRFISEDPIGFAAGDANLSRYVGNSTPNGTDPSGLSPATDAIRAEMARLQHEAQFWAGMYQNYSNQERRASQLAEEAGYSLLLGKEKGFAGHVCRNQRGLSMGSYSSYIDSLQIQYSTGGSRRAQASAMYRELDTQYRKLNQQLSDQLALEQSIRGTAQGPATQATADPRWTKKWIHVNDPNGDWLATFEYDNNNPEERDLAMAIAKQTQNGVTAERLGQILHNGIATGTELGVRVSLDFVDNIASGVEFVQDPTFRNALGMAPFIPGVMKKISLPNCSGCARSSSSTCASVSA